MRLATSVKPHKKLTLTGDYHAFWLADTHDLFHQANGAACTAGCSQTCRANGMTGTRACTCDAAGMLANVSLRPK